MIMKKRLIVILFISAICAFPQSSSIPIDPSVTIGVLPNGLKYYIQYNKKPEKRAELRLAVNAGSVLEDDNQKGLAHFCEHMAFNGSTHFKKNELVDYLESVGVKFGPELNAFTSFDETVYMLQVPTDKPEILEKGFTVLEDWAHGLAFDSVEIDKERGVITEEWRLGRGAQQRMRDKQFPILFKDSKYADRLPIGDVNIVQNCAHSVLQKFYKDWYRPELMCVVAVGDFDKAVIEKYIKEHFGSIPASVSPRERFYAPVPPHDETLFAIAKDKEAQYSSVAIVVMRPVEKTVTMDDFKKLIIENLFQSMLNARLQEITQQADPPFLYAFAGKSGFVRTSEAVILQAIVKEGGLEKGLETILREAEKARQYGFTATELERHKEAILRGLEKEVAEKDKTESSSLIGRYINNYLEDEPIPGIDNEYAIFQKFIPDITLADVNAVSAELMEKANRVVLVNSPDKEGLAIPSEKDLTAIMDKVQSEKITAYEDKVNQQPLVGNLPKPGKVVEETKNTKLGYTEWKLSNGVRVIVKQTDFKNDEIVFTAVAPGGSSLSEDKNAVSASFSSEIAEESGIGTYTLAELQKALSNKIVSVRAGFDFNSEALRGACSPKDAETMFQLIYLNFTNPRFDTTSFDSYMVKLRSQLKNRVNDPQAAFNDTLTSVLHNYHYRMRPNSMALADEVDLKAAEKFFKERFSDASGFTFVFCGNIDAASFKGFVEQYIGGLPSTNRHETWKDLHITNPTGIVERKVYKGMEPKSSVSIQFSNNFTWDRHEEYLFNSLCDALNIRLREVIREEKGGTYGVRVGQFVTKIPAGRCRISVSFGCKPERVDELIYTAFTVLDSMKKFGPTVETVAKVKETQKRSREVSLKTNGFWVSQITSHLWYGEDPELILKFEEWNKALSADEIKAAANKYLDEKNYVKVVLYPEVKK
jgi:zinc protease